MFEKKTIGDVAGEEGRVVLDYSKMKRHMKKCEEDNKTEQCKRELHSIGVDWMD